jgi:zinc protease
MKLHASILLALLLPGAAHAADPFASAQATTLPNGLTVLLAPDTTAASVEVGLWVRAGTRWESPGQSGISHLVERASYAGSAKLTAAAYARAIQLEGGTFSARTTPDGTQFSVTVAPEGLEAVLALEADRLASASLGSAALEAARRSLRLERGERSDRTPVGRALRLLFAKAFAGHPYRWPVVGLEGDLDRVTLRQAQAYRTARYAPGRMAVSLAGRFDAATALAAVRRTFGAWPGGRLDPEPGHPAPSAAGRAAERGEGSVPVLAVGWRTPPATDPDAPALEALARILAWGSSSRLQRELVRASGAPCAVAQGELDLRVDGGLLHVLAAPAPGADTARVEGEILSLVQRVVRDGVTAAELEGAQRQIEVEAFSSWQTPAGVGRALGEAWLAGQNVTAPRTRLERVRALTPADLQRVATRLFTDDHRSVAVVTAAAEREARR